jgi:hypothetical protein
MCKFNNINLAANWKEELLNHPKKITNYQSLSTEESFATTFEYPNNNTVIRINENQISHNKTREIVKYDENRNPISSSLFSYLNNEWQKLEENQYSYNSKENIKNCKRIRFPQNGNNIIEKSETQTLKTEKSLKKIITNKETNHQSIEEFTFDNYDREIEFMMYEIHNDEQINVLKTTNQFDNNIEIYSVFSTKSKESNEWSLISKTVTESFPDEMTQITEYFDNERLTSKERQIKYLNNSKQITEIQNLEMIENKWELITKVKNEYSNKYLKRKITFNFEDNNLVPVEKTEYENTDGFISKKICFEIDDKNCIKTSEQLYEYL